VCWLISTPTAVENVPEDMALKLSLLAKIEAAYGGHPIIATNSKSPPPASCSSYVRVHHA
jgi:3-hydroxyacyl-CoA dehydrogenase